MIFTASQLQENSQFLGQHCFLYTLFSLKMYLRTARIEFMCNIEQQVNYSTSSDILTKQRFSLLY